MAETKDKSDEDRTPPHEVFGINLQLRTECLESLSEGEVADWVRRQFEGCDMGGVAVLAVQRLNRPDTVVGPVKGVKAKDKWPSPLIEESDGQVEFTPALVEFIVLDRTKALWKEFLENYDRAVKAMVEEVGVGGHFQDEQGVVYEVVVPEWKSVKMDHVGVSRTRREGEAKGDLSMKRARELGYEVEGK